VLTIPDRYVSNRTVTRHPPSGFPDPEHSAATIRTRTLCRQGPILNCEVLGVFHVDLPPTPHAVRLSHDTPSFTTHRVILACDSCCVKHVTGVVGTKHTKHFPVPITATGNIVFCYQANDVRKVFSLLSS